MSAHIFGRLMQHSRSLTQSSSLWLCLVIVLSAISQQACSSRSVQNPNQKSEIEKSIHESYVNKDWDRFFALSQIYRASWDSKERNHLELLEGLALLKHCQFEILDSLLNDWKKEKPEWKSQLRTLLSLRNTNIQYIKEAKDSQNMDSYLKGITAWNLKNAPQLKVADAASLRVKVENRCE